VSDGASAPLTVMLVAGEPSGDQLGAQLMAALKEAAGAGVRIVGAGGPAMTAQGLDSLFPMDATAVMGLREVVPRIPAILRRVRTAVDFALKTRPNVVVLIDSPDYTHRIAQGLKRRDRGITTVNYVAPQVWASRQYRARKMAGYFDAVLTLLPFEGPFFEKYGLQTRFVGYPVLERAERMKGGDAFRAKHGVGEMDTLLAVLPGSRRNEIRFILPRFRKAVELLAPTHPNLVSVLPTVHHVAEHVRAAGEAWPTKLIITETEDEKFAAFDAADVALAASGTVTTELALAKTPMVVGYRAGELTYQLVKPLIRVKYITLINLTLEREAVPEFLQSKCTPELLAAALKPLIDDPAAREAQLAEVEKALDALGSHGERPSLRAARAVLTLAEDSRHRRLASST
jgi:lipid-A-disaccharide synthase